MCSVSMIADHYRDRYEPPRRPDNFQGTWQWPYGGYDIVRAQFAPPVTREEFDALKREVEEMKVLLLRAKDYDERNGEPHCEMEEKVALVRRVAEVVGVDLSDVFGPALT